MDPSGALLAASLVGLLFVEELGVPLPMFPADGMLIAAGVLAAGGAVPLWLLLPTLILVDMVGATLGYLWVRTLRRGMLRRPAERLERSRVIAILTDRLRAAGAPGVFTTRLVPGTRVYTNLAAGLIDLRPSTFLLGMLPASALWVSVITLLGALVGNRVRPYLARAEGLSLAALAVLAAVFAWYLVLRYLPDVRRRRRVPVPALPGRLPALLLGLGIDALIVAAVAGLVAALALGPIGLPAPDGLFDWTLIVGVTGLVYTLVTRLGLGSTTGEHLLRLDYHHLRG
jgi:membrane-associated protein